MSDVLLSIVGVVFGGLTAVLSFAVAIRLREARRLRLPPSSHVVSQPAITPQSGGYKDQDPLGSIPIATSVRSDLQDNARERKESGDFTGAIRLLADLLAWDPPPRQRAAVHLELGDCFREQIQHSEAETHFREAYSVAVAHGDDDLAARALVDLADVFDDISRSRESRLLAERALKIYSSLGDDEGRRHTINLLGLASFALGELDAAERSFNEALEIAKETGSEADQAEPLGNLGNVYLQRDDLNAAEEHYMKALSLHQGIGSQINVARNLANLGAVYRGRGDLDKAEDHLKQALAIQEEIDDRLGQANQLGNLANVYLTRGDLDAAEEHYMKALSIHEQIGNRLGQAVGLRNLGTIYAERAKHDKATENHQKALVIFEEIGAVAQAEHLRRLIERLSNDSESSEPDAPESP